jgi:phosphoenolpyruvate-protein kinase (PTS system EI component)
LIESADPGYDWIFGKNPSGLITKYGGAASHMAIRCAELNLPAAIGCGEILFNKLRISSKIDLDCRQKGITILEFKERDSFLEEKRILRSLGYIR